MKNINHLKKLETKETKSKLTPKKINLNNIINTYISINKENRFNPKEKINNKILKENTNIKFNKINLINKNLCTLLLIITIINKVLSKEITIRKLEFISEIKLNITKSGLQHVLNENFKFLPYQVIINDNKVTSLLSCLCTTTHCETNVSSLKSR